MSYANEPLKEIIESCNGDIEAVAQALIANDIRILPITYLYAIGHLSLEMDCYIKDIVLGKLPKLTTIVLAAEDKVANMDFLSYWTPYLSIVTDPEICAKLEPIKYDPRLAVPMEHYVMTDQCAAHCYKIYDEWGENPPLVEISPETREKGLAWLHAQGMPPGRWLALFHARECGNRPQDRAHKHRNVDIESYTAAMDYVIEQGGWCVRMGDPMMKPLRPRYGVIDYAHHPERQEWLDVFLCAEANFAIACASGFAAICSVFGTRVAMANLAPISGLPIGPRDVGIPKLVWSDPEKRLLSFKEIFDTPFSNARAWTEHYEEWANMGISLVANSSEEILELTKEMHQCEGDARYYTVEDDQLQQAFKHLMNPEQHYGCFTKARIGRNFLRSYRHLLPAAYSEEARITP